MRLKFKEIVRILLRVVLSLTVGILLGRIAMKVFVGNELEKEYIAINSVKVDKNTVEITGDFIDSYCGFTTAKINAEDGIVNIKIYSSPKNIFNKAGIKIKEKFENDIKEVRISDYVVWHNGKKISDKASKLFKYKQKYIGKAHGVMGVIGSAGVPDSFQNDGIQLQTSEEPYGVTIYYKNKKGYEIDDMKDVMTGYSALILACIDNAGEVTWSDRQNIAKEYTVTLEDANKYSDSNVKECAQNPSKLHDLVEKVGLESVEDTGSVKKVFK
ncbi:MAG: DUF4825 domain-containing protein [Lachnospiraceae bacterium]|nr:DUF4825 domain-containing protein [Lachnospiraceae bacterium]